ncbi:MAG: AAA family ATPase, partial [Pseudomonadota bacterium]
AMYRDFYSMAKDPFAIHPSPDNYFASRSHDQAFRLLMESVKEGEPYILVTGDYGIGKTLLCLKLCQFLETRPDIAAVTVSLPTAPYHLLLRSIAIQFEAAGIADACKTLAQFEAALFNLFISGKVRKSIYIIIDDLQDYSEQMLLHLRYLANFHIRDFYPFRLICFSYSGFTQELEKNPKFIPFVQRFRRRIAIQPLQDDELKEYIYFRMLQAGAKGRPIFDDPSLQIIADISGRIPRQVNNLCDQILLRAVELRADRINADLVRDACRNNEIESIPSGSEIRNTPQKGQSKGRPEKKMGIAINLDTIAINKNHNKDDMEEDTSSPADVHNRKQLKMTALVVGAVILLIGLFFLWSLSPEHDSPSLPKNRKISLQPQSNTSESGDALSSTATTANVKTAVEKQEDGMDSQQNSSIDETPLNSRIKIHQMTTVDSSDKTTESPFLSGERPYAGEKFNSYTPVGSESNQSLNFGVRLAQNKNVL